MAKNKYQELSDNLFRLVGGNDNISFFTHCVTRLRLTVKDKSKVDDKEIGKLSGVIGTQWQNEQFQIVIGQSVGDAYKLIMDNNSLSSATEESSTNGGAAKENKKRKISIGTFFDAITGCIMPLIPLLIGAGMLKVILLLLNISGVIKATDSTYVVLNFVGDAAFYFLPIMIGSTAAKKFGANEGIGMLLGGILVLPAFVSALRSGTSLSILGVPVFSTTYGNTIFPSIMSVFVLSKVEKFCKKISPESIRSITQPLLAIIIMAPLTYCLIGPAGAFLGKYITDGIMWFYNNVGWFGVAVLASVRPLLVMTGMHTTFGPVMVQMLSSTGRDPIILPASLISNMNQAAASLAVAIKAKDKSTKSVAFSSAITAFLGGVTEPAMFGVNLRFKTPLYCAMFGSFIGGAFAGAMKVRAYAFPGSAGIFSFPTIIGGSNPASSIIYGAISIVLGLIITMISTLIFYKPEGSYKNTSKNRFIQGLHFKNKNLGLIKK